MNLPKERWAVMGHDAARAPSKTLRASMASGKPKS